MENALAFVRKRGRKGKGEHKDSVEQEKREETKVQPQRTEEKPSDEKGGGAEKGGKL